MGIRSFFSKSGRQSRAVSRFGKVIANTKASGDDRWNAMSELAAEGSEDAIYAILKRYTYTSEVATRARVSDEQEKRYAYDLVVDKGQAAIPVVHRFLLAEEGPLSAPKHSISYALRILDTISPDEETTWKILKEVIDANEPDYERDSSRKVELLTFLGDWHKRHDVAAAIVDYLEDPSDEVRFQCAEALLTQGDELCKEPLLAILADTHESFQIRNRIVSGFIANGWVDDISEQLDALDEPGLMQATESLVALDDKDLAREALLRIVENKASSTRIRSRVAEWFVQSGISVHGIRGRVERVLPKGYKVAKKRVERFPDAMREPFITQAIEQLLAGNDPEVAVEPIARLLRNRDIELRIFIRAVEHLAAEEWDLGSLAKTVKKALPKGYEVGEEGFVVRNIAQMDEPFLSAAGDSLLDVDEIEDVREELIEVLINPNTDERLRERILDRFDRMRCSILGFDREIERILPREFKIQSEGHGAELRIVRVGRI